ncbi:MAG: glycosyltransferase family 2 protein [Deltaproteobacteria bacterium]|nr:glycosyltransferase family 2 protein [Deltaproteobacteria bacterium]
MIGAVENVINTFSRIGISGEIIVINDGSTDKTKETVEDLIKKCPFIRLINHSKPHGIGASFWEGVKESKGEAVVMLPGDGENDAFEILRYMPLMDNVDIIIPFVYNKMVRTLKRRIISKLYKAIINISFRMLLNYMNGTVMYRKCILEGADLQATGFFYQTELLIKCIKNGYLYAEVPYALKTRGTGESKAVTLKSLIAVTKGYLAAMSAVYLFHKVTGNIHPDSVTALRMKEIGG